MPGEFSAVQVFKWKQRHRRKQAWFKKAQRKAAIEKRRQAEIDYLASKATAARVVTYRDFVLRWDALWMGIGIAVERASAPQG